MKFHVIFVLVNRLDGSVRWLREGSAISAKESSLSFEKCAFKRGVK